MFSSRIVLKIVNILVVLVNWIIPVSSHQGHFFFEPELHHNWKNLDHELCGISYTKRIIGGKEAGLGEFPWLVLLGKTYAYRQKEGRGAGMIFHSVTFICGGSLLNRYYILTAAHCTEHTMNIVRAGEHNIFTQIDCNGNDCAPEVQDRIIEEIFPYEETSSDEVPLMDVALVKVEKPFEYNRFVLPICLPTGEMTGMSFVGLKATVAGWGIFGEFSQRQSAHILQKLKVIISKRDECQKWLTSASSKYLKPLVYYDEYQFCANAGKEKSACEGDSGGPLFARLNLRDQSQNFILGIVSYGDHLCNNGHIMFARVSKYLDWILDNIVMD